MGLFWKKKKHPISEEIRYIYKSNKSSVGLQLICTKAIIENIDNVKLVNVSKALKQYKLSDIFFPVEFIVTTYLSAPDKME